MASAQNRKRQSGVAPAPSPTVLSDRAREDARLEARKTNEAAGPFSDDAEAERRFLEFRSRDPFPDVPPALLNSADILDYVATTGMLTPFHPEKLKSASYEVGLLGPYVVHDQTEGRPRRGILGPGETFSLPRNSIVFMSVEPFFRLPDYIALRHNLKISHVHKGLLVGTGPLIDPGFVGRLLLPLHNLTENDYEFTGGEGIVWVEFTKLSPRPEWAGTPVERHGRYISFPSERSRSKTIHQYLSDAIDLLPVPASSSAMMDARSRDALRVAKKTRKTARVVSSIGVATLLALGLTFFQQLISMSGEISDLKIQIAQLSTATPVPSSNAPIPIPTPASSGTP